MSVKVFFMGHELHCISRQFTWTLMFHKTNFEVLKFWMATKAFLIFSQLKSHGFLITFEWYVEKMWNFWIFIVVDVLIATTSYNGRQKWLRNFDDTFRYWSTCSILFASSVNSLIPPAPQFNVVYVLWSTLSRKEEHRHCFGGRGGGVGGSFQDAENRILLPSVLTLLYLIVVPRHST